MPDKACRIYLEALLLDGSFVTVKTAPNDIDVAWEQEIGRRLEALRAGKVKPVPLADVVADIEKRFRS